MSGGNGGGVGGSRSGVTPRDRKAQSSLSGVKPAAAKPATATTSTTTIAPAPAPTVTGFDAGTGGGDTLAATLRRARKPARGGGLSNLRVGGDTLG